jgi:hypothetical protein
LNSVKISEENYAKDKKLLVSHWICLKTNLHKNSDTPMAKLARDFYKGAAKADPLNKNAVYRAELMQKVADFVK